MSLLSLTLLSGTSGLFCLKVLIVVLANVPLTSLQIWDSKASVDCLAFFGIVISFLIAVKMAGTKFSASFLNGSYV